MTDPTRAALDAARDALPKLTDSLRRYYDLDKIIDEVRDYAARAVVAALAAQGQEARRLPIETAPRDGSSVLVNDTTPGWVPWAVAHWLQGDEWQGWVYDDEVAIDNNPLGPNPTHWMPMPVPTTTLEDHLAALRTTKETK